MQNQEVATLDKFSQQDIGSYHTMPWKHVTLREYWKRFSNRQISAQFKGNRFRHGPFFNEPALEYQNHADAYITSAILLGTDNCSIRSSSNFVYDEWLCDNYLAFLIELFSLRIESNTMS